MIRIRGTATLRVDFIVTSRMSEEAFDNLSSSEQNDLIDNLVDWQEACRNAELDDLDIDDVDEIA